MSSGARADTGVSSGARADTNEANETNEDLIRDRNKKNQIRARTAHGEENTTETQV